MSLRDEYIAKVLKSDTIVDAFITNYSSLNSSAINFLLTSYKYGHERALEALPILRELKPNSE
jgi:hypothetical protein